MKVATEDAISLAYIADLLMTWKEKRLMANSKSRSRMLFSTAAALALCLAGIVVLSKSTQQKARVNKMPEIFSGVKRLEVVKASIIDTPAAGVRLEILNNSPLAVMAVDVAAGEGAITKNGLTDQEHPIVVIEPYGTTIVEMAFSAMTPGAPLVVSAVTYADGSEEGDPGSLDIMHRIRAHDRAKILAERDKQKRGSKP